MPHMGRTSEKPMTKNTFKNLEEVYSVMDIDKTDYSAPHQYAISQEDMNTALQERIESYPAETVDENVAHVQLLKEQGYIKIPNFLGKEPFFELKKDFDQKLERREGVQPKSFYGSHQTYFTKLEDPIYNSQAVLDIALNEKILKLISGYFECTPSLTSTNLRKSYPHQDPPGGNQLFHIDQNSRKYLKVFFYLNKVEVDNGPFMYVKGTNRLKHYGWDSKYLWSHREIRDIYGIDNIIPLTADVGDVVIAATANGFHCGLKPLNAERSLLTLTYGVHPEIPHPHTISQAQWEGLSQSQKDRVNLLEVLP